MGSNILRYKEDSQKSKEQLDIEKQNIILSRIVPFEIEGLDYNGLCERAKALHQVIWNLEANCYDYQQKFERQNYDMMELAERARQMNRGRRRTPTGHTGLGGSVFPWIAQNFATAPPKISLFSKYERQKDRRTFGERRLIYQDPEDAKAKGLRVEKPTPLTEEPSANVVSSIKIQKTLRLKVFALKSQLLCQSTKRGRGIETAKQKNQQQQQQLNNNIKKRKLKLPPLC